MRCCFCEAQAAQNSCAGQAGVSKVVGHRKPMGRGGGLGPRHLQLARRAEHVELGRVDLQRGEGRAVFDHGGDHAGGVELADGVLRELRRAGVQQRLAVAAQLGGV